MLDQLTGLDDPALHRAPMNLAARLRELRTRQGLKQSEIARKMGLDPSIPSLWEQGKRPVPASRVRLLADALGVPLHELVEGATDAPGSGAGSVVTEAVVRHGAGGDFVPPGHLGLRERERVIERSVPTERASLVSLVPRSVTLVSAPSDLSPAPLPPEPSQPFVPGERPALVGWIPEGWEPSDRVQDISPSLPDGYWLDPVRLERPTSRQMLRTRLCADDQALVGDRDVPGAALAERIYQHCSKPEGFLPGRLPLVEMIFRMVLAADYAGLPVDTLVESAGARAGAMPITPTLLRRLRDSVRPYPLRWVDRELFGRQ